MLFWSIPRATDALSLYGSQQYSPRHVQIDQSAGDDETIGILGNSPVSDLAEAEDAFQDQQRMLALGPDFRLGTVLRPLFGTQRLMPMALVVGEVLRVRRHLADGFGLPGVRRVTPHPRFIPMQEIRHTSA